MLAFDAPEPGLEYKHRWAAFGIAEGANGTIALVEVRKPGRPPYFDLPGGAVDGDEDEHAEGIRLRWAANQRDTPEADRHDGGEP